MDIKQMMAYVQVYIHIRKNKEVNINIRDARDVLLLNQAYNIALIWMQNNNVKLTIK